MCSTKSSILLAVQEKGDNKVNLCPHFPSDLGKYGLESHPLVCQASGLRVEL